MAKQSRTDVLIVGAGIAGLMAATTLTAKGIRTLVVDKAPHPGGRLATRHIGPGVADTGAQFFTVRDPAFRTWTDRWHADGLIFRWSLGWSDGSLGATPPQGHPRYAVHGGMRALIDHLAAPLDVRTDTRLVALAVEGKRWQAQDDQGDTFSAAAVLLTPPVPLSLDLLAAGEVPLSETDRAALDPIEYAPCLAGLFWLDRPPHIPEPGAIQQPNATITWVADNQRKGISPHATLITVHAGPDYSDQLWHEPDWQVLVALESGLRRYKDMQTNIVESHLERWRYAMPTVTHPEPYLLASGVPPLVFAGDAFGSPRVEGAALSGLAAGAALADRLAPTTARP